MWTRSTAAPKDSQPIALWLSGDFSVVTSTRIRRCNSNVELISLALHCTVQYICTGKCNREIRMRACNYSNRTVLDARPQTVGSGPGFYGEFLPRWPTLTTIVLGNTVQGGSLGVLVGFAGLPAVRAEEAVPPSNTKLKRLLAETMLDNAAVNEPSTASSLQDRDKFSRRLEQ